MSSSSKELLACLAGKLEKINNKLYPESKKGLLYLKKSEDGLVRFCWKNLTENNVEDDLIVLPGEMMLLALPQCTTAKSYVLKFLHSSERNFYWIQEPRSQKQEDDWFANVNKILADPFPSQAFPSEANYSSNEYPTQKLTELNNSSTIPQKTSLLSLFKDEKIDFLLSNSKIRQELSRYLPSSGQSDELETPPPLSEIKQILCSSQFVQTLKSLDKLLNSDQLANLLVQLDLDPLLDPNLCGLEALLNAVKKKASTTTDITMDSNTNSIPNNSNTDNTNTNTSNTNR